MRPISIKVFFIGFTCTQRPKSKEAASMRLGKIGPGAFVAAVLTGTAVFSAQNGTLSSGIVNQRVDAMDRMAVAGRAIATELASKSDPIVLQQQAMIIQTLAIGILDLFPEGSGAGQTNAKPEIWEHWPDFQDKAKALGEASGKLAEVAGGGDHEAIVDAFQVLGQTCIGCHQLYRNAKN